MQRRVLLLVELVAMVERMEETGLISLGLSRTAQARATMRRRNGLQTRTPDGAQLAGSRSG